MMSGGRLAQGSTQGSHVWTTAQGDHCQPRTASPISCRGDDNLDPSRSSAPRAPVAGSGKSYKTRSEFRGSSSIADSPTTRDWHLKRLRTEAGRREVVPRAGRLCGCYGHAGWRVQASESMTSCSRTRSVDRWTIAMSGTTSGSGAAIGGPRRWSTVAAEPESRLRLAPHREGLDMVFVSRQLAMPMRA